VTEPPETTTTKEAPRHRYGGSGEDHQRGPRNGDGDQTGDASWRKESFYSFYSRPTRARART